MSKQPVNASYLGRIGYTSALELQRSLAEKRKTGSTTDHLLLLEHPPVITLGGHARHEDIVASPDFLARHGIEVHQANRGGQATYHGPGQLIGYPVLKLRGFEGPISYIQSIEEVLIRAIAKYDISGTRLPGHPGVWVNGAKLAAIGVHISNRVATHGFAINLNTDLSLFRTIVPCGTPALQVTSLLEQTHEVSTLETLAADIAIQFGEVFDMEVIWASGFESSRQHLEMNAGLP